MKFEANRSNYSNTSENNNKFLVKSSYAKKANVMISENKDREILKESVLKVKVKPVKSAAMVLTDAACLRAWLMSSLISDKFLLRFSSSIFRGFSLLSRRLACALTSLTCFSAVIAGKT